MAQLPSVDLEEDKGGTDHHPELELEARPPQAARHRQRLHQRRWKRIASATCNPSLTTAVTLSSLRATSSNESTSLCTARSVLAAYAEVSAPGGAIHADSGLVTMARTAGVVTMPLAMEARNATFSTILKLKPILPHSACCHDVSMAAPSRNRAKLSIERAPLHPKQFTRST